MEKWTSTDNVCPKCGNKGGVECDESMILSSNPPQLRYRCTKCGSYWTQGGETPPAKENKVPLTPPQPNQSITGSVTTPFVPSVVPMRYGWICPKCGAVMSPDKDYCVHCTKPSTFDITF